jgi:pilus assembly protein Flp/PilA
MILETFNWGGNMTHLHNTINRFALTWLDGLAVLGDDEGQTLVEYALILVLIAIVVIAVLTVLGGQIGSVFGSASDAL